jgi:4-hydroxy-tetrahydrodipicolinate synthase
MFRGTFTALVTPFRDGAIDVGAFERLVESQIGVGISGIVAVGTTGESPTLTHDERELVIELAVKFANGRCKVLAGTGSYSTREAIAATQRAEKLGADGALVVAPYYNKPSQEGLFRHFQAIAGASSLPIMVYNIPGRCSVDIAAQTVARLADACPNIVSIKEAGGNADRASELHALLPESFTILSGDDSLTLSFLAAGAAGLVSVASNIFPAEISRMVDCFRNHEVEQAQAIHQKFYRLFKDLFIEPNPVPTKAVLGWRGMMSPDVRLPLCEMDPANEAQLRATLEALQFPK